ncbi:MAG TPA: DUF6782 family putative metallopeptidase [Alphaproteobacteria bacterium]
MRSERLTRKTHLKKHASIPDSDIQVFDLTQNESWALSSLLSQNAAGDEEEIRALPFSFQTEHNMLIWAAMALNESPAARAMMIEAAGQGWSVSFTDMQGGGFFMDTQRRLLLLDNFCMAPVAVGRSMYFRNALLTTFIRALRDIWHEERGITAGSDYAPEHALMFERVRAADCDTVTVLCCWELRGAGFADVWRHLLGSAEGDMAMVFTRFLERDPGALFDGAALAYAFRQWYADEVRVDGSDHSVLEALDDILTEAGVRNPFGQRELKPLDLEDISQLPDGTRYLAGLGHTVLHDPFFAGLHDPINQTHLFHLMYDMEVTLVNNVPFRDGGLARKIFPGAESVKTFR